jgi:hypothetical protein
MPRPRSLEARSEEIIAACAPDAPDRFVDLQLEVRHSGKCGATAGTQIGPTIGGRWDRLENCFVGLAPTSVLIEVDPGQIELMETWMCWFQAYYTDDWDEWTRRYGPRPFSFWAVGGRRRGKTWIGVATVALFAVALAGSFPWIVTEVEDDFLEAAEIPRYWRTIVPADWFTWEEHELAITLINGSRIELKSAHDPGKIKAGESSYVFYNEAQKKPQGAYNNARGAITDSGSIVLVAANPPTLAAGYWVQDMVLKLRRHEVDGYLKEFHDPNPRVVESSLDAMSKEMSVRDYAIEREGRFMARTDIVMHAFEVGERGNVRDLPDLRDVTDGFLRKKIGRPANGNRAWRAVVGADFQLYPHMAATVDRYFEDVEDPDDALSWTVGEAVVMGDENNLIDELEALGLRGEDTAVICDASGEWQAADRKLGRATRRYSWDMFRARGWVNLFKPSPWSRANPLVLERIAVGNARLRSHDHRQHAFVVPECVRTIDALAHWANEKSGFPSRRADYAHIGDAWTYPLYRLWPRKLKTRRTKGPIRTVNIHRRNDEAFSEGHDDERGPR